MVADSGTSMQACDGGREEEEKMSVRLCEANVQSWSAEDVLREHNSPHGDA